MVVLALGTATAILLMGWTSGCALTGDPPRARIEAALPGLRKQVLQVTVRGSSAQLTPEVSAEDLLRVAMASCVRYYCPPEGAPGSEHASPDSALPASQESHLIVLDFRSPQNVPTALPLSGWFGPLRGSEEMKQVTHLQITLERGQWPEVTAHHADATQSCWRSNWRIELPASQIA